MTVPQVIFNPEPSFSDEARKSKAQGIVLLLLVVGKDGHPYDIGVGQSLGMGLDEKAIEAIYRWRFRPARSTAERWRRKLRFRLTSTCTRKSRRWTADCSTLTVRGLTSEARRLLS